MAGLHEELSPVAVTEWLESDWPVWFQSLFFKLFSPTAFLEKGVIHPCQVLAQCLVRSRDLMYVCLRAKHGRSWLVISNYPECFAIQNRKEMANGYCKVVYSIYFPCLSFLCFFLYSKSLKDYVAARPYRKMFKMTKRKKITEIKETAWWNNENLSNKFPFYRFLHI